jgi:hypothetical protein
MRREINRSLGTVIYMGWTPRLEDEVDARSLKVKFSADVLDALREVAALARLSEHFDTGMAETLREWSDGRPTTVHDVMTAWPSIAGEISRHIRATNDAKIKEAWDAVCLQMPESGFRISLARSRRR